MHPKYINFLEQGTECSTTDAKNLYMHGIYQHITLALALGSFHTLFPLLGMPSYSVLGRL